MKVKKKLDGGLKKLFLIFIFFLISANNTYSSQILDFETEQFINNIIEDIKKVNGIKKIIRFKINNNEEINAFVDNKNIIYINSGLIQYSQDYVALLSVLAHEVGHIDLNHISLRKKTIENSKKINSLTLLSILAGTAITENLELLQTSILSSAAVSNQYIEFSKEQEIEADLYALKTLDLLDTNSYSIIKLLETIEKKLLDKGFSKSNQRISTHPYFEDRILLINNYENRSKLSYNNEYNDRFNFIRAKFLGYSNKTDLINTLDEPFKTYANSIKYAREGDLRMSLEFLNKTITDNSNSSKSFLLETKADILFSFGYIDEGMKFYKKNLKEYPLNYYAQIRIFENTITKNLSNKEIEIFFNNNKNLLYKYHNNKNILLKYLELALELNKKEWTNFINFYLKISNFEKKLVKKKFNKFKETNDKDLLKLIKKVEENIL